MWFHRAGGGWARYLWRLLNTGLLVVGDVRVGSDVAVGGLLAWCAAVAFWVPVTLTRRRVKAFSRGGINAL